MDPDERDDSRAEGDAARERLLNLLAEAAGSAVVMGLVNGVDGDRPGAELGDPDPDPGNPDASDERVGDRATDQRATDQRLPATTSRGPVAFLSRVCRLAVSEVGVSGAGVTVMGSVAAGIAGHRDQVASDGGLSLRLEDLQLTAGEGPCLDAIAAGAPVLVGDLEADAVRWPGFAPEALAVGVAAVFSLPLQVGAVRLGTFDLYRVTVGSLTRSQLAAAGILAGLVTETLLEYTDGDPDGDPGGGGAGELGWLADVHAEVHQASGMVSVRECIGVGEALLRIRAYAYANSRPITEVAHRIITRDLVLSDPES